MAAPQGGNQGQNFGPGHGDPYGQPQYSDQVTSPPQPESHADGAKKKKRGYAAQAYDFGAGANSSLGNAAPIGGAFASPQIPAYGGFQAPAEPQAGYGIQQPYQAQTGAQLPGQLPGQTYGQPPAPTLGGYQPPDAGYPGPGAAQAGGVGGITTGMGQMGISAGQQPVASQAAGTQQAATRPLVLNQLYPTDLLNQPLNVAELELPPPPIILPPNVSMVRQ